MRAQVTPGSLGSTRPAPVQSTPGRPRRLCRVQLVLWRNLKGPMGWRGGSHLHARANCDLSPLHIRPTDAQGSRCKPQHCPGLRTWHAVYFRHFTPHPEGGPQNLSKWRWTTGPSLFHSRGHKTPPHSRGFELSPTACPPHCAPQAYRGRRLRHSRTLTDARGFYQTWDTKKYRENLPIINSHFMKKRTFKKLRHRPGWCGSVD